MGLGRALNTRTMVGLGTVAVAVCGVAAAARRPVYHPPVQVGEGAKRQPAPAHPARPARAVRTGRRSTSARALRPAAAFL